MSPAVRAERDGATGEVIVRDGASAQEHEALAGARAWLALGRQRLDAGEAEEALAAARSGITELGRSYRSPAVIDDTKLKLAAADEREEEGELQDTATVALRVLETRTRLYLTAHPDVLG
jgi:hypothetical protein